MSTEDRPLILARAIRTLTPLELRRLAEMLSDGGEGTAGVMAVLPKGPAPKEGAAEVPFPDWPNEYWESQA